MNLEWFIAFIMWSLLMFFGGAFVDSKINTAAQVHIADEQTKNLAQGEVNITKFNEQWSQVDAKKDPCNSDTIPAPERRLLH